MEMKTVHYYIAVAEELNLTRAAERLMMSQPPLSYQMKKLEEELGVTLFLRGKRRLELTDAGKLFLRRAYELEALEEKSREEMQSFGKGISGNLSIGLVEGRAPYLAAHWMKNYREEHPGVTFEFWNGSGDDVIDRMEKGLLDLAFLAAPFNSEKMDSVLLWEEPWVAIFPADHPLAKGPYHHVHVKDLAHCDLVVPARRSRVEGLYAWFEEVGEVPNIIASTSNYIDAVALSEQGAGVSIFPQTNDTPNDLVVRKIISDPPRKVTYHMVWMRHRLHSAPAESFMKYVKEHHEVILPHSEEALTSTKFTDALEEIREL